MSGIIGYVGAKNAIKVLTTSLEALEYRGYDSAGIAYLTCNRIEIIKTSGKLKNLKNKINYSINTNIGIGHTRWATHGKVNDLNAHPHKIGKFTIVHNGIIENYEALKKILTKEKYKFKSETDSEIIAGLLDKLYSEKSDILKVLKQIKKLLAGSYALAILCDDIPGTIYAIRKDSPLIIGTSDNDNFVASDVPAILKYTKKYILLESNEIAEINQKITIYDDTLTPVNKEVLTFDGNIEDAEKNGFDHFMLKEIYEEPKVLKQTMAPFLKFGLESLINEMPDFTKYHKIQIIGSGSAYNAGLTGKYLIEKYSNMPVNVDMASEFIDKKTLLDKNTLVILISQSGETADTMAALRKAKEITNTLAISNVLSSSLAREADNFIYTKAGPEIAVTTTKAYLAQITVLSLIALNIAYKQKLLTEKKVYEIIKDLEKLPKLTKQMIKTNYQDIAHYLVNYPNCFYIGKGIDYTLCKEGALKLREIAYLNSSCYPAGEFKYGTMALIEEGTPVIAIITDKKIANKTIKNIEEIKTKGAYIILIVADNIKIPKNIADKIIKIPATSDFIQTIIAIIPLQLISYETAKLLDRDIDKPKNLAKTVTT